MMSKKTRGLIFSILLTVGLSWVGFKLIPTKLSNTVDYRQILVEEDKADYSNLVITGLQKLDKLEVLQLNVNYKMTIHGSNYNNKLFKNDKIVNLNTTGRYKIDLGDIKDNVIISGDNIVVLVHLEEEVFVNEDKTTYQDDKGWLVFYDVKVSPEEYNSMIVGAENNILREMQKEDNLSAAKKVVEEKVEEIVHTLGGHEYNVNIRIY